MGTARVVFDRWDGRYAERMRDVRSSAVRDLFGAASRADVVSFSGGMPDVSRVPTEAVMEAMAQTARDFGTTALQYGSSEGRVELRGIVVEMMAEIGVRVRVDDLVITQGAQQALDLLGKILIDPGDTIITEGPTYLGALQAFSAYQPRVVTIPMDDEGMRIDALEAELVRLGPRGAKFIYTIPNFQNPAGVTLSPERRRRLIELAREYDVPVIEDDPYGRLRFEGGHAKPLRALDEDVIYLGTFSKVFAPGLRLGWVAAPRPILGKLLLAKQAADLCGSAFAQIAAERYFTGTRWRRVVQDLTGVYAGRRDAMLDALGEHFPGEARWTRPEGGFFVWAEMPAFLDLKSLLAEAVEHGVTYVPGDAFFPDGTGRNCMRLAFCYAEPDRIREGIARLAEVLEDRLELYRAFVDAGVVPGGPTAVGSERG
ncbi:MAG: PLP-dependent aminotransferase family protein [Anaerosomatales bacterium]|nr:PLP-dependent aminotransferase family protein [Anaerosomatales bacterium]